MNRNTKGIIGFFVLTLIISSIITLPFMIGREIYQYNKYLKFYNLPFEWDDIIRYSLIIVIALILQIVLIICVI